MTMYRILFLLLPLTLLIEPASAQFYRYTDKEGVVRYTDDLTQVPEDQQAEAKKYIEIKSTDTGDSKKTIIQNPPATGKPEITSKESVQPKTKKKNLTKGEEELEKEYNALMKEKEQIEKDTETYSKRYKTRARKGVSRKKLKELKEQEAMWEKKFSDYKARKKALEMPEQKSSDKDKKSP